MNSFTKSSWLKSLSSDCLIFFWSIYCLSYLSSQEIQTHPLSYYSLWILSGMVFVFSVWRTLIRQKADDPPHRPSSLQIMNDSKGFQINFKPVQTLDFKVMLLATAWILILLILEPPYVWDVITFYVFACLLITLLGWAYMFHRKILRYQLEIHSEAITYTCSGLFGKRNRQWQRKDIESFTITNDESRQYFALKLSVYNRPSHTLMKDLNQNDIEKIKGQLQPLVAVC